MQTQRHSQTVLATLATVMSGDAPARDDVPTARRTTSDSGVFIVGDIVLVSGLGVQARRSFQASPATRRGA